MVSIALSLKMEFISLFLTTPVIIACPNYGRRGTGPLIKNGMVICIEPMVNMGSKNVVIESNGWERRTRDRKPSAHYEHTLAIINDQVEILTTFDYIEAALGDRFI